MKILEYEEYNGRVLVTVLYEDNTFATLNMLNTGNREEILKDVYIISSDVRNRQPFEGEVPTDVEIWSPPKSVATTLKADFYSLTGKVYDQYGAEMVTDVVFSVDNPAVRIENGAVVESEVAEDTPYTITATAGNLTESTERVIYKRVEAVHELQSLRDEIDILTGAKS